LIFTVPNDVIIIKIKVLLPQAYIVNHALTYSSKLTVRGG
jgi:hypothetical protein